MTRAPGAERLYRRLLALLPNDFRDRFEPDLADLFRDKYRAARARGIHALPAFWIRITIDLAVSAAAEHRRGRAPAAEPGGTLMDGLLLDIRHALRLMARRPALSLIIVLTLTLGIGANTAIFSLVNTVILRDSGYTEPERLMMVWEQIPERNVGTRPLRPANFFDWRARAQSFEDVAWSRDGIFTLTGSGEPESIVGYRFSANMLAVLGARPALGRGFTAEEDRAGGPRVVLLSDPLWRRRFNADPQILGRTITLDGHLHTVIGVMPPSFKHPWRSDLWTPIALTPQQTANRTNGFLRIVARLRPGVTQEQAQAEVIALYRELAERHPDVNTGMTAGFGTVGGSGDAGPLLLILSAGVGFVLMIACANVANLLLADATARRRELAVRRAVGASHLRVLRQMLTESVALALTGGALGALVIWWMREGLVAIFPANIANLNLPLVNEIDFDLTVVGFTIAVSLFTGVLMGLLPAWNLARVDLQGALRDGGRGGTSSHRAHRALVIAEVAVSVVLVAGALLMVQSFIRVQRLDFGFEPDRVLSGRVILPAHRYPDAARGDAFVRDLLPKLRAIAGVEQVGLINYLPLSGWSGGVDFTIEGRPPASEAERPSSNSLVVNEDYFRAMGVRTVRGRVFEPGDDAKAPPVVVINETLARRYWAGDDPVGRRVLLPGRSSPLVHEIVGIVGDVRSFGLEEPVEPEMYFPISQRPTPVLCIALRTNLDAAVLASQLRAAIWSVDRDQPVTHVLPMASLTAESLAFRRAGMLLAGSFGLLALVLAAIGIYGVLSYSVSSRTREIGVRLALGARPSQVASLVIREGVRMTTIGLAIGMAAAAVLTGFLASVLYEVRPGDPLTHALVAVILLLVSVLATWLPSRRATGVDPVVALRGE